MAKYKIVKKKAWNTHYFYGYKRTLFGWWNYIDNSISDTLLECERKIKNQGENETVVKTFEV